MPSTVELLEESQEQAQWPSSPVQSLPAYVARVEEFCLQNFTRPIGVRDLARVANMSRCHFSREFRKASGISPGKFISQVRMDHAMRLVKAGGRRVKDMAQLCGFSSANYFCKVFRKSYGASPGSLATTGIVLKMPSPSIDESHSGAPTCTAAPATLSARRHDRT